MPIFCRHSADMEEFEGENFFRDTA